MCDLFYFGIGFWLQRLIKFAPSNLRPDIIPELAREITLKKSQDSPEAQAFQPGFEPPPE